MCIRSEPGRNTLQIVNGLFAFNVSAISGFKEIKILLFFWETLIVVCFFIEDDCPRFKN